MDTVKSSDATEIIDTPSSGMITPPVPRSSEVHNCLQKWVIRMQAALAILPPPEKEALRMAFWAGLQFEVVSFIAGILYHTFTKYSLQVQITSMIRTAFLKDMQLTIPPLIKKAAAIMDEFHSLPQLILALDELRAVAFPQGHPPPEIHQDRWVEEWWNNLDSATFPAANVNTFSFLHCFKVLKNTFGSQCSTYFIMIDNAD
jgi:hypothetical protein